MKELKKVSAQVPVSYCFPSHQFSFARVFQNGAQSRTKCNLNAPAYDRGVVPGGAGGATQ